MAKKTTLGSALQTARKARGLSQEAFSDVSSRTYLSTLERGLKSPTLKKLEELCEVLDLHPLTLLLLSYTSNQKQARELAEKILDEAESIRTQKAKAPNSN
ncbi:helix-turn-helix domain-containing protein [Sedimenticola sp.]|uniref:helix-turn-helix domain-containing protein n=1 Tax=Sedimenticola sp. TaxID=1940285 RepID=UPI003D150548